MSQVVVLSRWFRPAAIAAFAVAAACGGAGPAGAQDEGQQLTVGVAVCPSGEAAATTAACAGRRARDYELSVYDAANAPLAETVASDSEGQATVDLGERAPGDLRVIVNTAVGVGTRAVACEADGASLPANLAGSGAAIPVFQVSAQTTSDISCTVELFGFPNDARLLDIVSVAAKSAPANLPATGAGAGGSDLANAALAAAIAAMAMLAAYASRRELSLAAISGRR